MKPQLLSAVLALSLCACAVTPEGSVGVKRDGEVSVVATGDQVGAMVGSAATAVGGPGIGAAVAGLVVAGLAMLGARSKPPEA